MLKLTHNLKSKFGDTPVVGEDVVVILKKGGWMQPEAEQINKYT